MQSSWIMRRLRDATAIIVVALFMFPLLWWGLTSIKPSWAIFDKDEVVFFNFMSIIIAVGSTLLTILLGVPAAYALSRMRFRGQQNFLNWVLSQRFMPPIAIIVPIVFMYHYLGLLDSHLGLMLIDTLMNIPICVLLMKSFFDDVATEIDEAAMIDGATRFQIFQRIVLPLVKSGVAATAVLCFIFSWTEFLLSLFLTTSIRTLPVKISTFVTSTGTEWGFIAALGTSAMLPSFIFILLVQRQLVRGLTLGSLKD
jgi:multiple sugar transport system permease protein